MDETTSGPKPADLAGTQTPPAQPMPEEAPAAQVPAVMKAPKAELVSGNAVTAIIPRTIEEVGRIAKAVIMANLAPDSYKTGSHEEIMSKVIIGIMHGAEVGLPPIKSLSSIAIINGRPTIWGDGAMALIMSRGVLDRIQVRYEGADEKTETGEPTPADFPPEYKCVVEIWRRGVPNVFRGEFSVQDARRAHLWGNPKRDPWMKYPKRMLFMRARAWAIRDGFADVLAGLQIREEIEDLPPPPPAKTDTSDLDVGLPAAGPANEAQGSPDSGAPQTEKPKSAESEPPLPLGEPKRRKARKSSAHAAEGPQ